MIVGHRVVPKKYVNFMFMWLFCLESLNIDRDLFNFKWKKHGLTSTIEFLFIDIYIFLEEIHCLLSSPAIKFNLLMETHYFEEELFVCICEEPITNMSSQANKIDFCLKMVRFKALKDWVDCLCILTIK